MTPLLALVHPQTELSLLRNCAWTLCNLCRGQPQPLLALVCPALAVLSQQLLLSSDSEVLTDALWTLAFITDGGVHDRVQAFLDSDGCARIVELMLYPATSVQTPALRTIGHIVTGNDEQRQVAIDAGALPCLLVLLGSAKKAIRKEAAWAVSSICAGSRTQIQAVIDADIVEVLVQLAMGPDAAVRKEAVGAIRNATCGGSPEQIEVLVQHGAVIVLSHIFDLVGQRDFRMDGSALEGIENILRAGDIRFGAGAANLWVQACKDAGVLETLHKLRKHPDSTMASKAVHILVTWFQRDVAPSEPVEEVVEEIGDIALAETFLSDLFVGE